MLSCQPCFVRQLISFDAWPHGHFWGPNPKQIVLWLVLALDVLAAIMWDSGELWLTSYLLSPLYEVRNQQPISFSTALCILINAASVQHQLIVQDSNQNVRVYRRGGEAQMPGKREHGTRQCAISGRISPTLALTNWGPCVAVSEQLVRSCVMHLGPKCLSDGIVSYALRLEFKQLILFLQYHNYTKELANLQEFCWKNPKWQQNWNHERRLVIKRSRKENKRAYV